MCTDNYADIFADGCYIYIDKWNVFYMHTENKFPKVCRSYHPHADGGLHVIMLSVLATLVGQESKDQLANQAFVARTILRKIVQEPSLHHPQADADVKACQGVWFMDSMDLVQV